MKMKKGVSSTFFFYCKPICAFWNVHLQNLLYYTCQLFWRRHDHFRRFPKTSEVFRRSPKSSEVCRRRINVYKRKLAPSAFHFKNQRSQGRYCHLFIYFTHGFRSLHRSELTYFWKLCQARWQQLTFSNQAREIGPQAWAGMRLKFSTRRRETQALAGILYWNILST